MKCKEKCPIEGKYKQKNSNTVVFFLNVTELLWHSWF